MTDSRDSHKVPNISRLGCCPPLSLDDRNALQAIPYQRISLKASSYVLRAGEKVTDLAFLVSGYAIRQKLVAAGARQIVGVSLPGDIIDIIAAFNHSADCSIQLLTDSEFDVFKSDALRDVMRERPSIAEYVLGLLSREAVILRDWVANIGRRNALTRVAHLLCEFASRHDDADLSNKNGYFLPMSQHQIADATGLTSIHVNRMLKALRERGFIQDTRRGVSYPSWKPMREIADFRVREA